MFGITIAMMTLASPAMAMSRNDCITSLIIGIAYAQDGSPVRDAYDALQESHSMQKMGMKGWLVAIKNYSSQASSGNSRSVLSMITLANMIDEECGK